MSQAPDESSEQATSATRGFEHVSGSGPTWLIWVVLAISGLMLAGFVINGLYTRFWADDFCIEAINRSRSFLEVQSYWRNDWTGRFAYVLMTHVVIGLGPAFVPVFALGLAFLALACGTWTIGQALRLYVGESSLSLALLFTVIIAGVYLELLANREESFYWLTGALNYTLPLALFPLYWGFVCLSLGADKGSRRLHSLPAFLLPMLLAGFAETYTVWQTAVLGLALMAGLLVTTGELRDRVVQLVGYGLLGSVVGAGIVYAAPGNAERQSTLGPQLPFTQVVEHALSESLTFLADAILRPELWLTAAFVAVLTYVYARRLSPSVHGSSTGSLGLRLLATVAIVYVLLVATYLPGWHFLGRTPDTRVLASATLTMVLAFAYLGHLAGREISVRGPLAAGAASSPIRSYRLGAALLLTVVAALALPIAARTFAERSTLAAYASAWDERDAYLQDAAASGNLSPTVRVLTNGTGLTLEMAEGSDSYMNECAAVYYRLRSVTGEP